MLTVPRPRRSSELRPPAPAPDRALEAARNVGPDAVTLTGPVGTRYVGDGGPYVIAHRGGAALARENTLAAFDRSYALGVRYLETDVRMTSDGECVAVHDATLTRVTGAEARVDELTLSGIRRLGIGGDRVLRIADLLATFESAKFVFDLKDPKALPHLVALLHRAGATDRVCLAGARDRWLLAARELAGPALNTALGWEAVGRLVIAAKAGRRPVNLPPAEFVHLPRTLGRRKLLTRRVVDIAHDLGMRVMAWDVEDADAMHQMLDIGVDGLITDRPDLARDVLVERDAWVAPTAWPAPEKPVQGAEQEKRTMARARRLLSRGVASQGAASQGVVAP
ncbi:glycerophosphodiester phosphodiesterase family protein [Spongisporangium articulatum]|uniref:Glycerophosphodiester phosphodiesterase family protein n=1 Tax=Spongisporangium articulatum TaxID=3362603 RepID=A0ABW8AJI9_9ACTN